MSNKALNKSTGVNLSTLFSNSLGMLNDGVNMLGNAVYAGERATHIAASKMENLAVISDTADTLKLLHARKDLDDAMVAAGVTIDSDGNMVFASAPAQP